MFDDSDAHDENRRSRDGWHVGREIPIAVIALLLVQTASGVWFMASLSNKVDLALSSIQEFKIERYTREDGRRDRELFQQMLGALSNANQVKSEEIDRRLSYLEGQSDRAAGRINNQIINRPR